MKRSPRIICLAAVFIAVALRPWPLLAQAPDVPIESTENHMLDRGILDQAKGLRESGNLIMTIGLAKAQLDAPVPDAVKLPKAKTRELSGRDIARTARQGHVQIGWYYRCRHCEHWHVHLAGGYGVGKEAVATCYHCVDPGTGMQEGYLIAVDYTGKVLPVTAVLASSKALDGAILRVVGGQFAPLAFSDNVAPGDRAYCFSSPFGQAGYFSEGIVNRFIWHETAGASGTSNQWDNLRINVSTDWAPGSSGAAVLDQAGNAIGHVSTIQPMKEDPSRAAARAAGKKGDSAHPDRFGGATLITLHYASPARDMLALAAALRDSNPGFRKAGDSGQPARRDQ